MIVPGLIFFFRAVNVSSSGADEVLKLRSLCEKGQFDTLNASPSAHLLGLLVLFLKDLPQPLLDYSVRGRTPVIIVCFEGVSAWVVNRLRVSFG